MRQGSFTTLPVRGRLFLTVVDLETGKHLLGTDAELASCVCRDGDCGKVV